MSEILYKVLAFVFIIALGAVLRRLSIFKADDFRLIGNIVFRVTLPCAVISFFSHIAVDMTYLWLVPLGVLCNFIPIGLGWLAGLRAGRRAQAFNMINFSGYNIGCFTLPYIQSFLGPAGVVATCLFDAGNSVMCTGATYSIASAIAGDKGQTTVRLFLRRLFSSFPMDVYIVMVLFAALGIQLPKAFLTITDTIGAANPFLAMFMIGIGFELHLDRESAARIALVIVCRYCMAAVLAYAFWNFAPFDAEIRKVLAVISFAPVSAVCTIFTSLCFNDARLVALSCTINSLSIVISLTAMTVLMIWL